MVNIHPQHLSHSVSSSQSNSDQQDLERLRSQCGCGDNWRRWRSWNKGRLSYRYSLLFVSFNLFFTNHISKWDWVRWSTFSSTPPPHDSESKFQTENAEHTNLLSTTIGMFHPSTLSFFFSFLASFHLLKSLSTLRYPFLSSLNKTILDVVFHNGAVINHAVPYSAMRQENVIGTKQVIIFKQRWWSTLRGEGERTGRRNIYTNPYQTRWSNSVPTTLESHTWSIHGIAQSSPKQAILKYPLRKEKQNNITIQQMKQNLIKYKDWWNNRYVTSEMGEHEQVGGGEVVEEAIERRFCFDLYPNLLLVCSALFLFSFFWFSPTPPLPPVIRLPHNTPPSLPTSLLCFPANYVQMFGSKLVPFHKQFGDVEKVAFQKWTADLLDQIGQSSSQTRKHLEGLLLFLSGLKFKKEIEERSAFVVSRFEEAANTYTESEIEQKKCMYMKLSTSSCVFFLVC